MNYNLVLKEVPFKVNIHFKISLFLMTLKLTSPKKNTI